MLLQILRRRQTILSATALTAFVVVAINIPASAVPPVPPRPASTGSFVGSVSGSFVLLGDNTASGNPFNDYGIEGKVDNDVGGVGILGYGKPAKSYGVYGVSFGTNGIGVYGAGDGPAPVAGATPSSTQQSTGVVGNSQSGEGVFGSTEFPNGNFPGYLTNPAAGVMGVDLAGNAENVGVAGITTGGGYGVFGMSGNDAFGGVLGTATNGDGVDGSSTDGIGTSGTSSTNWGGSFSSTGSYGLVGQTHTTSTSVAGTFGGADSVGYGVWGSNHGSGIGVYALSVSGDALFASTGGGLGAFIQNTGGNGADINGSGIGLIARAPAGTSTFPFVVTDSSANDLFFVNGNGDVRYHGSLGTFARTRNGFTANTFTPRAAAPTIEDVGSGQLVNGQALVRLDPALVEQMDRSSVYHVFLTPGGDTRGLFVATKTAQGFLVREAQGGRSTFAFDYRVVAAVDGQANQRMTLSSGTEAEPRAPIVQTKALSSAPGPKRAIDVRARTKKMGVARTAPSVFVPQSSFAAEHRQP